MRLKILVDKGGQKHCLLTFSLHCLCSSTSHLFISCLCLVYWSTLKIANDLPIFASYYAFVVSLTWLAYFLSHNYLSSRIHLFFNLFFVSLWRRANARNVRLYYGIRIGSTPTFLCLYSTLSMFFALYTVLCSQMCFLFLTFLWFCYRKQRTRQGKREERDHCLKKTFRRYLNLRQFLLG